MQSQKDRVTLVTGASGFVGNNLVRHLIDRGRRVRALIRHRSDSLDGLDIERVSGDVTSPESIESALCDVDVVYHLAAVVSIDTDRQSQQKMRATNIEGTQFIAEACLKRGIRRLIHFSSVHALSHTPSDQAIDETRPLASNSKFHLDYDLTKAAAEVHVNKAVNCGLDAVIINPVGIIGPRDFQPSPTGEFLSQLANRKLPGLVRSGFHWVDVRDVVEAAVVAEDRGRRGDRYILSSEFASFRSIAKWVFEETGARPPFFNAPVWLARTVAPAVARFSRMMGKRPLITPESIKTITFQNEIHTTKAMDELDFRPRSVESSVKDAIRWLSNRAGV